MAETRVYGSLIDNFLDDREPNWEETGLKDAEKSGEEVKDRTGQYVDDDFLDDLAGESHHTVLPTNSKGATLLNRLAEKEAASPRLSANRPAGTRLAASPEDYQNDNNDSSLFDEVTSSIEKAHKDADPDNIEKRNQSDSEVKAYVHKLLNQGTTPSRVAALLEKVAEIELLNKKDNMGASYLKDNAGLLGYAYMEPNTFMDNNNPNYERQNRIATEVDSQGRSQCPHCHNMIHPKYVIEGNCPRCEGVLSRKSVVSSKEAAENKGFCKKCNKKVTLTKREGNTYCPDCKSIIATKPKQGSRATSSKDCVTQFNAWKAAGVKVRAHSVKKISACDSCSFFKDKTCNLYHLPVVANAAELSPIINKLTAGVPASSKRAALVRLANRIPEQSTPITFSREKDAGAHTSERTIENIRETRKEAASTGFDVKTIETMHKEGMALNDIYKKGSSKVGSVVAGRAVKAFVASLKDRGTKIALSQIDCTLLKQKLGMSNAIVGAAKCADCIYRSDMHCGLTGGTLLTFPGMEKTGKTASTQTNALTVLQDYDLVNAPTQGDIDIREPERLDIEMGSVMTAGDL